MKLSLRHARGLLATCALALATLPADAAVAPGERTFIDGFLSVPQSVLTTLGQIFPEQSAVGKTYLSQTYDPNLLVTERATVSVTFLWEGAGYRSAFGYFTYALDGAQVNVLDRQLVFPNASFSGSGGVLATGDTVTLRDGSGAVRIFEPGTRIAFFVMANAWNGSSVTGWNANAPTLPSSDPAVNAAAGSGVYTTIDELNPETAASRVDVARHAAMLRFGGIPGFIGGADFLVVGIEDLRRTGSADNDFNDVMFLVQSTPIEAIEANVATYIASNPDPDGDGVQGLADYFPLDADRAFTTRTPPTSWQTVAFEDNYPSLGDADYNDAVVQTATETVTRADGSVKEIVVTDHLIARGAGLDHALGVAIDGVPANATGTVQIERFASDGSTTVGPVEPLAGRLVPLAGGRTTLRIADLFPSTRAVFGARAGYTNTTTSVPDAPPGSARVRIVFDTPIAQGALATPPFDPFLLVHHGAEDWDVHLPGHAGFLDRPAGLRAETGATAFLDANGAPWALLVPYDWRFPLEAMRIGDTDPTKAAYPQYQTWVDSRGTSATSWFASPTASRVTAPLSDAVRTRPWRVLTGGAP